MNTRKGWRTCFRGGHLLTGDGQQPVRGGMLVVDGKIERLFGPGDEAAVCAMAEDTFDATGMLLTPPLFDAHVHSSATLFRGTENSLPLELWSYHAINYGLGFTERCLRASTMLTAVEMIHNGIGGYIDHLPQARFASVALDAHIASGLRVGLAPFFADLFDEDILGIPFEPDVIRRFAALAPRPPEEIRDSFAALHQRAGDADAGRIRLLLGPNAPQRCSDILWQLWRDLRDRFGLGSHTHLLETLPQADHCRTRWPGGVVAALDRAGLLDDRLSVAHAVWLDDHDRELLARRGVVVSHNPVSNGMLGSGSMAVRPSLDAGITLALGTDSSNTGGRHDLFQVMRQMLVAGRVPGSDFDRWITPQEVFRAATWGGSQALGSRTGAGTLRAGGPADVLALDFRRGSLAAAPVGIEAVVVHADQRSVGALMVAGDWLLRGGEIKAFDEAAVTEEAEKCAAELREIAGAAAADLAALRAPYAGWHARTFTRLSCGCGGPPGGGTRTHNHKLSPSSNG
jgi:cytosine/adenosine deaminase-related metal-dependent hydrolase